jgi:hypothetical protein
MKVSANVIGSNNIVVTVDEVDFLISYNTVIAKVEGTKVTLDSKRWDCSVQTSKHRNLFLGETTKETSKKIKDGVYLLDNLN